MGIAIAIHGVAGVDVLIQKQLGGIRRRLAVIVDEQDLHSCRPECRLVHRVKVVAIDHDPIGSFVAGYVAGASGIVGRTGCGA